MAKRGYIPTVQEVRALAERAEAGDADALAELGQLNNKLAKRANERMRDIERKGLVDEDARINRKTGTYEGSTAAYNKAKYWLSEEADFSGNDYFSQGRVLSNDRNEQMKGRLSPAQALSNIEAASEYLRSQTSTAAGEFTRRHNILSGLDDAGFFNDIDVTGGQSVDDVKAQLLEFFETDAWAEFRKVNKGGTNPVVAQAVDALASGALISDFKRAFRDYQLDKVDTDYIEIWDNWSSATTYYRAGEWHQLKKPRR